MYCSHFTNEITKAREQLNRWETQSLKGPRVSEEGGVLTPASSHITSWRPCGASGHWVSTHWPCPRVCTQVGNVVVVEMVVTEDSKTVKL